MRNQTLRHASLALFSYLLTFALTAAAALSPTQLKVEYRHNPLGIDTTQPRLSWILKSSDPAARGEMQSAYQIVVATSPQLLNSDKPDLWDTGKVASDRSIQIAYAGKPLASRQNVWWKVRVWDNKGDASPWSEPAMWSMGLLTPDDWNAKWIGLESGGDKAESLIDSHWIAPASPAMTAYYRCEVETKERPIAALAMFVGAGNTTVYVNGKKPDTPQRGKENLIAGDMTGSFTAGKNVVEVAVTVPAGQQPALIGSIEFDSPDGEQRSIYTDKKWTVSTEQPQPWPKSASLAGTAKVLGPYGMAPWGNVGFADRTTLRARMLRKQFNAPAATKRATAYVSGLGWFELYLNGNKISNDVLVPALSDYDKRVYYMTYDVTSALKQGPNAVGVILGNGRFFSPRGSFNYFENRTFNRPRVLLQLEVEYADGKREIIASDQTWKVTDNGSIGNNNEYDGEEYDARKEMRGWATARFNDSSWQKAEIVTAPAGKLSSQPIEPIRVVDTLKPVKVTEVAPGKFLYDLGQNMVGWVRVTASGPAGAQIKLRHSETLRPDGSLYIDNLRTARATDLYTMKGGAPETYEPSFVYHGFRYVEVTTSKGVWEPVIEGRVVSDPLQQNASFESSNSLLNQIHKNIVWGTKGNYHSLPTDCPQRDERMGWLGDRAASSRGEMYLFDNVALYSKWVMDMEDAQRPDGSLSDVSPAYWPAYSENVTWPSSFIIIPRHLYELQGDTRIIEQHYAAMKKWMEHMATYIKADTIAKDTYGDWCVPPESPTLIHSEDPARRTDGEVLASAYYYYLLRLMADNARLLNKPQDAAEFNELADRIKLAYNKKFFHPETNTYANATQTSSILPLAYGLAPDDRRNQVFQSLVNKIAEQNKGHVGTGLIGIQWLMRTLTDNGRPDLAYEIAAQKDYPSWGYMVEKGATTVWELWNGDTADPSMNSGNHLMLVGDLNIWFYERLAGIQADPANPGFKHIILKPAPVEGLTYVKASHASPHGDIGSKWQRDGSHLRWDITVPPNTTATVYVPAKSAEGVREGGLPASNAPGVKFAEMKNGTAVYEVGSGTYSFSSELPGSGTTQLTAK